MYIRDGDNTDYNHRKNESNNTTYAWGWLGNKVESSGWDNQELKNEIVKKFKDIAHAEWDEKKLQNWLKVDCTRGTHHCEICGKGMGNASIKISHNGKLFVCPSSVYHYIEEHDYKPDDRVIEAIQNGYYCREGDLNVPFTFEGEAEDFQKERERKLKIVLLKGCLR